MTRSQTGLQSAAWTPHSAQMSWHQCSLCLYWTCNRLWSGCFSALYGGERRPRSHHTLNKSNLFVLCSLEVGGRCSAEISEEQEGQKGLITLNPQPWPPHLPSRFFLLLSSSSAPRWWSLNGTRLKQWSRQETNQDLQYGRLMTMIPVWTGLS